MIVDIVEFKKALDRVARTTTTKSENTALRNVWLKTDGDKLVLTTTNTESTTVVRIHGTPHNDLDTTVNHVFLRDTVATRTEGEIKIIDKGSKVQVRQGRWHSSLNVMGTEYFPRFPADLPTEKPQMEMLLGDFIDIIAGAIPFVAKPDDARVVLTGVNLVGDENSLTINGTDGYRVAIIKKPPIGFTGNIIVPGSLKAILAQFSRGDTISVIIEDRRILVSGPSWRVVTSLVNGTYPHIAPLLDELTTPHSITVDRAQFLDAISSAAIVSRTGDGLLYMQVNDDSLSVMSYSVEVGESETVLDAQVEGKLGHIAIKMGYLSSVLRFVKAERVTMLYNMPSTAIRFSGDDAEWVAYTITR